MNGTEYKVVYDSYDHEESSHVVTLFDDKKRPRRGYLFWSLGNPQENYDSNGTLAFTDAEFLLSYRLIPTDSKSAVGRNRLVRETAFASIDTIKKRKAAFERPSTPYANDPASQESDGSDGTAIFESADEYDSPII